VVELSAEETRALLEEVAAAYRSRPEDALLTALAQALAGWTGEPRALVELEASGRESPPDGLDLSRTVGALAVRYPALLEQDRKAQNPGDHLKSVKEQLRAVPQGGTGYGLLRYLGEEAQAERLRAMPAPEVVFRYHGGEAGAAASSLFAPAGASDPGERRGHLLEIDAEVVDGRLRMTWTAAESLAPATAQGLADRTLAGLRALIEHGRSEGAGGFTPSDFPEARFSQKDFNSLMNQLGKRKPGR
jgi:non-ribosomal peptide synthase protein (TIGR01720 family)